MDTEAFSGKKNGIWIVLLLSPKYVVNGNIFSWNLITELTKGAEQTPTRDYMSYIGNTMSI